MLSTIFAAISGNAIIGWLSRRVWDWGGQILGWLGFMLGLFAALDPATQATVIMVLQGRWGEITLLSVFGLVSFVASQVRSYRATVTPQIVLPGGQRRVLTEQEARELSGYLDGPIEDRTR